MDKAWLLFGAFSVIPAEIRHAPRGLKEKDIIPTGYAGFPLPHLKVYIQKYL